MCTKLLYCALLNFDSMPAKWLLLQEMSIHCSILKVGFTTHVQPLWEVLQEVPSEVPLCTPVTEFGTCSRRRVPDFDTHCHCTNHAGTLSMQCKQSLCFHMREELHGGQGKATSQDRVGIICITQRLVCEFCIHNVCNGCNISKKHRIYSNITTFDFKLNWIEWMIFDSTLEISQYLHGLISNPEVNSNSRHPKPSCPMVSPCSWAA